MKTLIIDIPSQGDSKFLIELAKKLGFKARVLSLEEKEDLALGKAIQEGMSSESISEKLVKSKLKKWL